MQQMKVKKYTTWVKEVSGNVR